MPSFFFFGFCYLESHLMGLHAHPFPSMPSASPSGPNGLTSLSPLAFSAPGSSSSANRFVGIGPRDGNFLNIPQQSQVGGTSFIGVYVLQ